MINQSSDQRLVSHSLRTLPVGLLITYSANSYLKCGKTQLLSNFFHFLDNRDHPFWQCRQHSWAEQSTTCCVESTLQCDLRNDL